uniref:GH18 domain-containing protein n=1 Tax=Arion vulgaris TaxID=1028688 RepID=A0A0B6ZXL3_9EUPU
MFRKTFQYCLCILFLLFHVNGCVEHHENRTSGKLMVCYYIATTYLPARQVPADMCTHIIYAFGQITKQGIQPSSPGDLQNYKSLVQLKQKNPNLKVLLSLQVGFPLVVRGGSAATMKSFSQSAVRFLSTYGFDGVDLDWEYPAAADKSSYSQFIKILRNETVRANMLLSAAIPNNPNSFVGYDADCLARYLDFMTAMTYDFHIFNKKWGTQTGYNSPLFTPSGESKFLSTSAMILYYLQVGIPANKLLMGIPLYGRSWTLSSASDHGLHASAVGKGGPSPYRHLTGVYVYPDVCVALQNGANNVLDGTYGAAYLYANKTWVAYDGTYTVNLKLSWMAKQNLGGVGVWAMHLDDLSGVCKTGLFPMLTAIKSAL